MYQKIIGEHILTKVAYFQITKKSLSHIQVQRFKFKKIKIS